MKFSFWYTFLAAILLLFAGACKQGSDIAPTIPNAYLDVINATDTIFNVYLNGSRLNTTANIGGPGSSGYLSVPPFTQNYSIKRPINAYAEVPSVPTTVFNKSLNLDSNKHYSLFVTGSTAASAFLVNDSLPASTSDTTVLTTAHIRFVHAAPDLGAVNVVIDSVTRFQNVNYKSASSFVYIKPPEGTNSTSPSVVNIYSVGSTTAPVATLTFTFTADNNYTVFIRDTKTAAGVKASAGYVTN